MTNPMPFDQGLTHVKVPAKRSKRDRARFVAKLFVPILYQDRDFEAFDDFSDFVESVSCGLQKPVKFVVRIHAGEPTFRLNCLEPLQRVFVRILYTSIKVDVHNLLNLHRRSDEHGFETCKSMLRLSRSLSQSLLQ